MRGTGGRLIDAQRAAAIAAMDRGYRCRGDCVVTASVAGDWVPGRADLVRALPSAMRRISDVRCEGFGQDEPTEFGCRYQASGRTGRKSRCVVYIAMDGASWIVIDDPTCRRR